MHKHDTDYYQQQYYYLYNNNFTNIIITTTATSFAVDKKYFDANFYLKNRGKRKINIFDTRFLPTDNVIKFQNSNVV